VTVPYERRATIARLALVHCGVEPTDERVAALAESAGRFDDLCPPLTADQRARLGVLLRPALVSRGAA
jgi:hypothetical protein